MTISKTLALSMGDVSLTRVEHLTTYRMPMSVQYVLKTPWLEDELYLSFEEGLAAYRRALGGSSQTGPLRSDEVAAAHRLPG